MKVRVKCENGPAVIARPVPTLRRVLCGGHTFAPSCSMAASQGHSISRVSRMPNCECWAVLRSLLLLHQEEIGLLHFAWSRLNREVDLQQIERRPGDQLDLALAAVVGLK